MPRELRIRPATGDDYAVAADLRRRSTPDLVMSDEGMRARLTDEEVLGAWLATLDGEPAGFAHCRRPYEGHARVSVFVPPEHRLQGVGSRLLAEIEATGVDGALSIRGVADEPDGLAFAKARGFTVVRRHKFSAADTADAPPAPAAPDGVDLQTLDAVDPRDIWALTTRVGVDDPSGLFAVQSYETWHAEDWAFPDHAPDLGVAALVDGTPVAFTHVFADRSRCALWSAMTGVVPEHRGHGLAKVVKATSLAVARNAGFTRASTANDGANAAMLAVNAWLGYRPTFDAHSVERVR